MKKHLFWLLVPTLAACSTTHITPTVDADPGPPVVNIVASPRGFSVPDGVNPIELKRYAVKFSAALRFSEVMQINTLEKSIQLLDSKNNPVPLKLTYQSDLYNYRASTTVDIQSQNPLNHDQTYTLKVLKTAQDITGQDLVQAKELEFITEKSPVRLLVEKSAYAFNAEDPTFTLVLKNLTSETAQKIHLWTICENTFSRVAFRVYLPQLASQTSVTLKSEVFGGENIGHAQQVVCKTSALAESQDRDVVLQE